MITELGIHVSDAMHPSMYRVLIIYGQERVSPFSLCICRRIINDSLRTDVCLLYPPYLIALGKPQPHGSQGPKNHILSGLIFFFQKIILKVDILQNLIVIHLLNFYPVIKFLTEYRYLVNCLTLAFPYQMMLIQKFLH